MLSLPSFTQIIGYTQCMSGIESTDVHWEWNTEKYIFFSGHLFETERLLGNFIDLVVIVYTCICKRFLISDEHKKSELNIN